MAAAETAVLLINYGGPSGPGECEEYLRNIFLDPALMPIPGFIRPAAARFMAHRRAPRLTSNYEAMGRYSPIVEETTAQAEALEGVLGEGFNCVPAMRYSKPFIAEAIARIVEAGTRNLVVLPMYPQESRATTGSAVGEVKRAVESSGFRGKTAFVRSFHLMDGYIESFVKPLAEALRGALEEKRVLFAAHGLPVKLARRDPYPGQVAESVFELSRRLGLACETIALPGVPTSGSEGDKNGGTRASLAWQSRVGPVKWLEPSVEDTLMRFSEEGVKRVVAVPVSFVCEHSETLYELDLLYAGKAHGMGMEFTRIPTPGVHPAFIEGLAKLVREAAQ